MRIPAVEMVCWVNLTDYLVDNNINECNYRGFLVHNTVDNLYGLLFETDKGLLFQKHKYTKIEMKYTYKLVDESFLNSFKYEDLQYYLGYTILDEQSDPDHKAHLKKIIK